MPMKAFGFKVIIIIFFYSAQFSNKLFANHLMGGEITWESLGNAQYKFKLYMYRSCQGINLDYGYPGFGIRVHNHPTVTFISLPNQPYRDTLTSATCQNLGQTCSSNPLGSPPIIEVFIFESNTITLQGVPPTQGWVFTFSQCCRNLGIFNINPTGLYGGITIRSIMYPYNGLNTLDFDDDSPVFQSAPVSYTCANNPTDPNVQLDSYSQNASDADLDHLVYSFAQPLDSLSALAPFNTITPDIIPFNPTMSFSSPLPGALTAGFPNSVPALLNSSTGQMSFLLTGQGTFVFVIRVQAFRCGVLVAEIFRDMQFVSVSCPPGNSPDPTSTELNGNPITPLISNGNSLIDVAVTAGEMITIDLTYTDLDNQNFNNPPPLYLDSVFLGAFGEAFGEDFVNVSIGCDFPPCATLNPPPGNGSLSAHTALFQWQTNCNHSSTATISGTGIIPAGTLCNLQPSATHLFNLRFYDDACPIVKSGEVVISITVESPPLTPSPELRCLEVLPGASGDVKLTWIPPPDPENQFEAYHIFRSSNFGGPYVQVATINSIAQTTYTDVNANADNDTVYYYISTLTGCSGNILNTPLDTLATMYLEITDVTSAGNIGIDWNEPSIPLIPSSVLPYGLFKTDNNTLLSFSAMLTPPATSQASDAVSGCNQQVGYYAVLEDALGCFSISNVDSGTFSTTAPPPAPTIDSVSVNPLTNEVTISWQASTLPLADSIIIERFVGGAWVLEDSARHPDLFKVLLNQGPEISAQDYRLLAKDLCKKKSAPSSEHQTLKAAYALNNCAASVSLTCNPYAAWGAANVAYRAFQSVNGGPFAKVDTIIVSGSTIPSITITGLISGNNYCFYLQAFDPITGFTSSSDKVCFTATVEQAPAYTYLSTASVLNSGGVYSYCLLDATANITRYAILRSISLGNEFDTLASLPIGPGTAMVSYTDNTALSNEQSYTYKYLLFNKCDSVTGISNPGRTILLEGIADDGFVNKLWWNNYGEWDAQVFDYTVYRAYDLNGSFIPWQNTVTDTFFVDRVDNEVDRNLTFCYVVKAYEGPGNAYGVRETSWSNILCLQQDATIYFPTAFSPGQPGINAVYKPQGLYETLAKNLKFAIYNRWGEEVFYTEDLSKGWDGTYKFGSVPSDIYAVRVTFELPDGTEFKHTGSVMVIY